MHNLMTHWLVFSYIQLIFAFVSRLWFERGNVGVVFRMGTNFLSVEECIVILLSVLIVLLTFVEAWWVVYVWFPYVELDKLMNSAGGSGMAVLLLSKKSVDIKRLDIFNFHKNLNCIIYEKLFLDRYLSFIEWLDFWLFVYWYTSFSSLSFKISFRISSIGKDTHWFSFHR